eukprot:Colp12_sorted_trinity150504_noHs@35506
MAKAKVQAKATAGKVSKPAKKSPEAIVKKGSLKKHASPKLDNVKLKKALVKSSKAKPTKKVQEPESSDEEHIEEDNGEWDDEDLFDDEAMSEGELDDEYGEAEEMASSEGASMQSQEDDSTQEEPKAVPGSGMADAMSKILNRNIQQEVPILAKEKSMEKKLAKEKEDEKIRKEKIRAKREAKDRERVKPDVRGLDEDRKLIRIATKGVVQLFNAVRDAQKNLEAEKESGKMKTSTKEKAVLTQSKESFLDMLKSGGSKEKEAAGKKKASTKQAEGAKGEKEAGWRVFRDDFMLDSKMKDFDKQQEEENDPELEMEDIEEMESDNEYEFD